MKIRVVDDRVLSKAVNKANLVLVEVSVNGKNGQHRAHRWKSPNVAMKELKGQLKNVSKDSDLEFIDKKGNKKNEKEFLKDYKKNGKGRTVQKFLKEEYKEKIFNKNKIESFKEGSTKKKENADNIQSKINSNKDLRDIRSKFKEKYKNLELIEKEMPNILEQIVKHYGYAEPSKFTDTIRSAGIKNMDFAIYLSNVMGLNAKDSLKHISMKDRNGYTIEAYVSDKKSLRKWVEDKEYKFDMSVEELIEIASEKVGFEYNKPKEERKSEKVTEMDSYKKLKSYEKNIEGYSIDKELIKTGEFENIDGNIFLKKEFSDEKNKKFWSEYINAERINLKYEKAFKSRISKYNGKMLEEAKDMLSLMKYHQESKGPIEKLKEDKLLSADDKNEIGYFIEGMNDIEEKEHAKQTYSKTTLKRSITKDKEIQPTNSYKKVLNKSDYISSIAKIKNYNKEDFALASMDMLGVDAPLVMGRSQSVHGLVRSIGISKDGSKDIESLRIQTNDKRPDYMQKSTIIHESMHTKTPGNLFRRELEEVAVETAAKYAINELEPGIGNKVIPSYVDYVVNALPVLKKMDAFNGCKKITDFGSVFMEAIIGKDYNMLNDINNHYNENIKIFNNKNNKEQYFERYLPKESTKVSAILDKHEKNIYQRIDNSFEKDGTVSKSYMISMSTLISALKSGSLTISDALNNSNYKDIAFVLLACILDEEGIEEFEEFMS